MKKIALFLCIAALSASTIAQDYFLSNGIVYGVTSPTEVQVEPYDYLLSSAYSGAVTIPQTVEHDGLTYTVTALDESAFESCRGVTSLTLPTTIRSIGSYCFYDCTFTSLQLPDSLRRIDDHAFLYSRVGSLHLPACFEEYGDCAFWARNLTSLTVDEANPHFRSIGGWLYSKDSLTLCVVPDGVTGTIAVPSFVRHLDRMAMGFNMVATSVSLPEGLESIGSFAFNCCGAINNVVIPSTVSRIGLCPFSYCPQLTNLTISSGNQHYVMDGLMLYSANYDTLLSCHKSGATVTLRPTLKVIGGFENNTWVKNITIPESVTDIMDNCFNACTFTSITLPQHMNSIGELAFGNNNSLTTVTMPRTLRTLGTGAFNECMKLTAIVIPDSLRVIPQNAFNACLKMASITWGNCVEEIGPFAFWTPAVKDLVLPPTLRKVGEYAFGACSNSLKTVTFTGPVDTLGQAIFRQGHLRRLRLANEEPPATLDSGCLYDIASPDSIVIPCGSTDRYLSDPYWSQFAGKYYEACGGVEENADFSNQITFYPNPCHDLLYVETAQASILPCIELQIIDMQGRLMLQKPLHTQNTTLNLQGLPPGLYLLRTPYDTQKLLVR